MKENDSLVGDDFIDIKFVKIKVRMTKLWSFNVEIKVHCYFEKVNEVKKVSSGSSRCGLDPTEMQRLSESRGHMSVREQNVASGGHMP